MRSPEYERLQKEEEERVYRKGAVIIIATCHILSAIQWACYIVGGSWWGG